MDNSIIIKGSSHGIHVILDDKLEYDVLLEKLRDKFKEASKFLGSANMALSFEGRTLSSEEELEIIDIISEESDLKIVCILDNNGEIDKVFSDAVNKAMDSSVPEKNEDNCHFYKGTLRSGQVFESESSVIILGDVNPGAKVVSKGNVIVLGSLRGNIFAGASGNINAFVVALEMNPMQIKIGDIIARSADTSIQIKGKNAKPKVIEPKIAYVYDDNIYIENLDQEVLSDIII
ncbi:MAG: septum site-determining protein MinC [Lachnospira sp.]